MKWKMIRIELLVLIKYWRRECRLRRVRWWACKETCRTWWLLGSMRKCHWARWNQDSIALTPGTWNMPLGQIKAAWWVECKECIIKMPTLRIKIDNMEVVNRPSMIMGACTQEYNNHKLVPTMVIKESWYLIMLPTSQGASDPGKLWTSSTTPVWEEACEEVWLDPWKDQSSVGEVETESVFSKSTLTRVKDQTSRSMISPEMSLQHWTETLRTNNNPYWKWNDNKTSTI